jgi:hypothetical protein
MAYRLEEDGSRVYLCEDHILSEEREDMPAARLQLVRPSKRPD